MAKKIILGGIAVAVSPPPLGVLKGMVPAFNRAGLAFAGSVVSEAAMDDIITVIAGGAGKSRDEIEAMPATFEELLTALQTVGEVAGLTPRELDQGEAPPAPGPAATGTTSTPG